MNAPFPIKPNTEVTLAFLQGLDLHGRHDLVAIDPLLPKGAPGKIECATFFPGEWEQMRRERQDPHRMGGQSRGARRPLCSDRGNRAGAQGWSPREHPERSSGPTKLMSADTRRQFHLRER